MKLSNLIGKQIYSLYETMAVGTTFQAVFNNQYTKLLGFYFFDENEDEHFINFLKIHGFGDNLTIKNFNQISSIFPAEEMPSPLNKQIIDEKGNSLGNLVDMEIDAKGKILSYISSKQKTIPIQNIQANNDFVLCGENLKLNNFKPKQTSKNTAEILNNIAVKILKIEEPQETNQQFMPPKLTISANSLVGKIAKNDIFGKNNELIIRKNQSITPKALEIIKKHNKLNQLYHMCF